MSEKNKETKKQPDRKYLFAILDDDTHDFRCIIRGTKHAAIFAVAGSIALICIVTFCLVAFTPLKRILPGYPSYSTQREAVENAAMVDSLETRMRIMTLQLTNIRRIIAGEEPLPLDSLFSRGGVESAELTAEEMDKIMYAPMEEQFGEQFGGGTFRSESSYGRETHREGPFGRSSRSSREGEVKIYVTSEAPEKRVAHGVGDYVDFEETKTDDKKR